MDGHVSGHVEIPKVPKYEDVTIDVLTDEKIAHLLSLLDPSTGGSVGAPGLRWLQGHLLTLGLTYRW